MKEISRLKLTQLNKAELSKREQNRIIGGDGCCICACRGSSPSNENGGANKGGNSGLSSPGGGTNYGGNNN